MLHGVDVSAYQPVHFPVTDSQSRSANFAFIKLTQGTGYVNPNVEGQVTWARAHDIRVGFYHFLEAGNVKAQIAFFREKADTLNVYHPGDMLAIDWESYQSGGKTVNVTNGDKDLAIGETLSKFPQSRVVLYCNKDYWLKRDKTQVVGDGLWIAAPDDPDGAPRIQHGWVFQQVGENSNEDWDVSQFETRAQLNAWADGKVPAVTLPTEFVHVVQTDGIQVPAGHVDPDGNWSLGTYVKSLHQHVEALEAQVAKLETVVADGFAKLSPPAKAAGK